MMKSTRAQPKTLHLYGDDALMIECYKALIKKRIRITSLILNSPELLDWAESTGLPYQLNATDALKNLKADSLIINCCRQQSLVGIRSQALELAYFETQQPLLYKRSPIALTILEERSRQELCWGLIENDKACLVESAGFEPPSEATSAAIIEQCLSVASEILASIIEYFSSILALDLTFSALATLNTPIPHTNINDINDRNKIQRLFRALNFGTFNNPYQLVSIKIEDTTYVCQGCQTLDIKPSDASLSLIQINNDTVTLQTRTGKLLLKGLHTYAQKPLIGKSLKQMITLPYPLGKTQKNSYLVDESELLRIFRLNNAAAIPYFKSPKSPRTKPATQHITAPAKQETLLAALVIYIAKLNNTDSVLLARATNEEEGNLLPFYPMLFEAPDSASNAAIVQQARKQLESKCSSIPKDFFLRHHGLKENNSDWQEGNVISFSSRARSRPASRLSLQHNEGDNLAHIHFQSALLNEDEQDFFANQIGLHLEHILSQIIDHPNLTLEHIAVNTPEDHQRLISISQGSKFPQSHDRLVPYFENAVKNWHDHVAIIDGERKVSYQELHTLSDTLAHHLSLLGHEKGSVIGLYGNRSAEVVIAILGILKSGATYLPIDKKNPPARICAILSGANCSIILYEHDAISEQAHQIEQIKIVDLLVPVASSRSEYPVSGEDPACLIFTSGSTGKPKGVFIPRRAIVNHVDVYQRLYSPKPGTKASFIASIGFDGSIIDIFPTLLSGSTLVVAPPEIERDPNLLIDWANRAGITHTFLTTPLVNLILKLADTIEFHHGITIIAGGAALNPYEIPIKNLKLSNIYGPTETTAFVAQSIVYPLNSERYPSIGRAVDNNDIYLLNPKNKLAPIGCPAEIYITGLNLSLGYTDKSLTEKKFVTISIDGEAKKAYATGDLARYLPDGNIDFIGRKDTQNKINGYLVDTTEIKQALLRYSGITQAAVITQGDQGTPILVGYLVADKGGAINLEMLKQYMAEQLPSYMQPAFYILLNRIPTNINQKIDIQTLEKTLTTRTETESSLIKELEKVIGVSLERFMSRSTQLSDIGLNSLKRIELAFELEQAFNVPVTVNVFYKYDTFEKLAQYLEAAEKKTDTQPVSLNKKGPLSGPQKLIANFIKLNPESPAYNIAISWVFRHKIDANRLSQAFEKLFGQQPLLTSRIDLSEESVELIKRSVPIDVKNAISPKAVELEKHALQNAAFDFSQEAAIRIKLLRHDDCDELFIVIHHIIFDDWSLGVFCEQLSALYNNETLSPSRTNYLSFCELSKQAPEEHKLAYWKKQLSAISATPLPYNKPPKNTDLLGKTLQYRINSELFSHIKQTLSENNITFFGALCAVFAFTLSVFSRSNNVYFIFPYINRERSEFRKVIGYFSNTLPLIYAIDQNLTLHELIKLSLDQIQGAIEHSIDFESVNNCLPIDNRDNIRLAQTLINYQLEKSNRLIFDDEPSDEPKAYYSGAKLDLSLNAFERNGELVIEAEFNSARFSNTLIESLLEFFSHQLENIAWQLDTPLNQLTLCSPEQTKMLGSFEKSQAILPRFKHTYEAFNHCANQHAEKTALISDDGVLSYTELKELASSIAIKLNASDRPSPTTFGILLPRGTKLIATLMACLKAGCTYILLNPDEDEGTLKTLIKTAKVSQIICDNDTQAHAKTLLSLTINIDETLTGQAAPEKTINTEDTGCLLYTSGTTSQRKVLRLSHKNLMSLALSQQSPLQLGIDDTILSVASVTFDAFHWEVLGALLSGATLVILREKTLPGQMLNQQLRDYAITQLTCTPPLLTHTAPDSDLKLKRLIMGGELCPPNTAKQWQKIADELYASYGPAEGSVAVTLGLYDLNKPKQVGRTFGRAQVYLLDGFRRRVPPGFVGNIHIGGDNVCQGYLGNDALNESAFCKNPFGPGKLYMTGDLGRWLSTGELEFLGREDRQIKLFGYRIELEAVANAFLENPAVEQAVAKLVTLTDSPALCLYFVAKKPVSPSELKNSAREKLPFYMLPHYIVQIEQMPMTNNGKIDAKALPQPIHEAFDNTVEQTYSDTEKALIDLWKSLLPRTNINRHTEFFEAGGHSILAAHLIDSIQNRFGISIRYADLIKHSSVKALATLIDGGAIDKSDSLIHINTQNSGIPIILIHPMGGTIFWYLNSAKNIKLPVFAIQDPSIDQEHEFNSIQEMAKHYYALIKRQLPQGPYILGGASSGSNIAAEISELMHQNNDKVLALLSLDGWALYPKRFEEKQLVKDTIKTQAEKYTKLFKQYAIKDSASWLARQDARIDLMLKYKPCEIHCPLYLFKAQTINPLFESINADDNHWKPYCHNTIQILSVAGDHETMHESTNAESLSAAINQVIDKL